MDPQVYKVVSDIYRLLEQKKEATLTEVDIAYISGQLKTLIDIFTDPSMNNVDGIQAPPSSKIKRFFMGE
jgi:hypothetical protein